MGLSGFVRVCPGLSGRRAHHQVSAPPKFSYNKRKSIAVILRVGQHRSSAFLETIAVSCGKEASVVKLELM